MVQTDDAEIDLTRGQKKVVKRLFGTAGALKGGVRVVEVALVFSEISIPGASGKKATEDHARKRKFLRRAGG